MTNKEGKKIVKIHLEGEDNVVNLQMEGCSLECPFIQAMKVQVKDLRAHLVDKEQINQHLKDLVSAKPDCGSCKPCNPQPP